MAGLIVHEWLEPRGGAERVIDSMREAFPDADLLALWNDAPEKYPDAQETWLAKTPLRSSKAAALAVMPSVWRHVAPYQRNKKHDWILVSSHLFAHHVRPIGLDRDLPKFVYAHTPARYIWEPDLDARGSSKAVRIASTFLKPMDRWRAQESTEVAANSEFVRDRIRRVWNREATVIYPPVDIERIKETDDWRTRLTSDETRQLEGLPSEFVLGASRLVPYKRLDWVIRAAETNRLPVVIAGSGPDKDRLMEISEDVDVPVFFVEQPSTELLFSLYQACIAYVFPAVEDFGIMPVEAQACGTPVVVTSLGGAKEVLEKTGGGVIAHEDSAGAIAEALRSLLESGPKNREFHAMTSRFSKRQFKNSLVRWVCQE